MQTIEECIEMYKKRLAEIDPQAKIEINNVEDLVEVRQNLRRGLATRGLPSNPGVTDKWILDRVEEFYKELPINSINTE